MRSGTPLEAGLHFDMKAITHKSERVVVVSTTMVVLVVRRTTTTMMMMMMMDDDTMANTCARLP
jgi:hypothetical protein